MEDQVHERIILLWTTREFCVVIFFFGIFTLHFIFVLHAGKKPVKNPCVPSLPFPPSVTGGVIELHAQNRIFILNCMLEIVSV